MNDFPASVKPEIDENESATKDFVEKEAERIDEQVSDFLSDGRFDEAELDKLIDDLDGYYSLPAEERNKPVKALLTSIVRHTEIEATNGPIPPPRMLAGYEEALPGSGDRIIAMAESQQAHRHRLEDKVVQAGIDGEKLGTIIGGAIATVAIIGSMVLIAIGRNVEGLTLVIGELVGLLAVFFRVQASGKKELQAKREQADSNSLDE